MKAKSKTILKRIDDIAILIKFLYSDAEHYVMVSNVFGRTIKIGLNNSLEFTGEIVGMPNTNSLYEMNMKTLCAIIDQLEQQKPIHLLECNNRWEEIKLDVATTMALNNM